MILVGDLNIAPLETDVWSHKQLLTVVSHTPIEVEKLGRLQESARFVDAVRHFVPPEQRLYSWWSYRNRDWAAVRSRPPARSYLGDAAACSPLSPRPRCIARCAAGSKASDHVPVVVRLGG